MLEAYTDNTIFFYSVTILLIFLQVKIVVMSVNLKLATYSVVTVTDMISNAGE